MINSWPLAAKIIIGVLTAAWCIEAFLLPFKLNIHIKRGKEIESLLRQIFATVTQEKTKRDIRKSQMIDNMLGDINKKGDDS